MSLLLVDTRQPGKFVFDLRKEAEDFAAERVKEMWVTHMRPTVPGEKLTGGWVVEWWCQ
jgi:hypothetical protein